MVEGAHLKVVWYVEKDATEWEKCWRVDSERLESLYCYRQGGQGGGGDGGSPGGHTMDQEPCLLENTRLSADMSARTVKQTYTENPVAQRLVRGTWFLTVDSKVVPLPEDVTAGLVDWFLRAKGGTSGGTGGGTVSGLVNGRATAKVSDWGSLDAIAGMKGKQVSVVAELVPPEPGGQGAKGHKQARAQRQRQSRAQGARVIDGYTLALEVEGMLLAQRFPLSRGHAEYSTADLREEMLSEGEAGHLCICVHGIGEQMWGRKSTALPPWQESVADARACLLERREALRKIAKRRGGDTASNSSRGSGCGSGSGGAAKTGDDSVGVTMGVDSALGLFGMDSCSQASRPAPAAPGATLTPLGDTGAGEGTGAVEDRIECLPVLWHESIHTKDLSTRMANITMPNLLEIRGFTNEALLDVLLFMAPASQLTMLNALCARINAVYKSYCAHNPIFVSKGARCSLVGHSLGTVLLFELLSRQQGSGAEGAVSPCPDGALWQLTFSPHSCFALGSPVGMFLNIGALLPKELTTETADADMAARLAAGQSFEEAEKAAQYTLIPRSYHLPSCRNYYNIIHQHDVVSYRIEPLLDPALTDREPALVPRHDSEDGLTIKSRFVKGLNDFNSVVDETVGNTLNLFKQVGRFFNPEQVVAASASAASVSASLSALSLDTGAGTAGGSVDILSPSQLQPPSPTGHTSTLTVDQSGTRVDALLNGGHRVDFRLQTNDFIENKYLEMLPAHGSYMGSMDVASFIMSRLDI